MQSTTLNNTWSVGENVRVRVSDKLSRRACIAVVHDDAVDVEWETAKVSALWGLSSMHKKTEDIESTILKSNIKNLLPEELGKQPRSCNVKECKLIGDQLLRLHDYEDAIEWYDGALDHNRPSVGSIIFFKDTHGFVQRAEVDCVDDSTLDVALETGYDMTLPTNKVLLTLFATDADRLQEKILLNAGRCWIQLDQAGIDSDERAVCLKRAVLAFTLALSVAQYHDSILRQQQASQSVYTALLLRSQAQSRRSKYTHAKADIQALLKLDPSHKEGLKRLHEIDMQQKAQKKADKKLAKQVCQWVQETTEKTGVSKTAEAVARYEAMPSGQIHSLCGKESVLLTLLLLLLAFFVQTLL
jgi:tetratricopeptide (TPR) repeat protein